MSKSKIKPLGERVVVKPITKKEEASASGIILPESDTKERTQLGEVVSVGSLDKAEVSVGDKVLFSEYGYDTVEVDDEEYYVIKEDKLLAVIK